MKKFIIGLLIISLLLPGLAFSLDSRSNPSVVKNFDAKKYMGRWYEIAHKPNFFQRNCEYSTADYTLNENNSINVFNTCYRDNKIYSSIEGTATAPDENISTKLKVDFGFFIKGDYWIIDLDENYQWAVVSGPRYKSVFILSRSTSLDPEVKNRILENLKENGVKTDEFIFDKYEGQP